MPAAKWLVHLKAKGHAEELKKTLLTCKSSLFDILLLHRDLPVAGQEVQSGKKLCIPKAIECVLNLGEQKCIWFGYHIQFAVIFTKPESSSYFAQGQLGHCRGPCWGGQPQPLSYQLTYLASFFSLGLRWHRGTHTGGAFPVSI